MAENWGLSPYGGGGAGSPSNNVANVAYLQAKFHLDPSNRLATIHQHYRQTDRQWSDSTGRTVLQTVAQKSKNRHISATVIPIATNFDMLTHSDSCNIHAAYLFNNEFLDRFATACSLLHFCYIFVFH